jgi:FHA domain
MICPSGHMSTEDDFCSECGVPMKPIKVPPSVKMDKEQEPVKKDEVVHGELCPECLTPRTMGSRFCEVCRYDYQEGRSFTPSDDTLKSTAEVATSNIELASTSVALGGCVKGDLDKRAEIRGAWVMHVTYHVEAPFAELSDEEKKSITKKQGEKIPLMQGAVTIGRVSSSVTATTVVLDDAGISRKHLRVELMGDSLSCVELGSANGTELNGVVMAVGEKTTLKSGDELKFGLYTTVIFERCV